MPNLRGAGSRRRPFAFQKHEKPALIVFVHDAPRCADALTPSVAERGRRNETSGGSFLLLSDQTQLFVVNSAFLRRVHSIPRAAPMAVHAAVVELKHLARQPRASGRVH